MFKSVSILNALYKSIKIITQNKFILFSGIIEKLYFFIIFLIFARIFSQGNYGQIISLFALANIYLVIFDLGLPVLIQREITISSEKNNYLISSAIIIYLTLLIFYIFLFFITCNIIYGSSSFLLVLSIAIYIYLNLPIRIFNSIFYGLNDLKSSFFPFVYTKIITLILVMFCFYFDLKNILLIVTILLSGNILQIIHQLYLLKKYNLIILDPKNLKNIFDVLKLSLPISFTLIFSFLYDKIDVIIISKALSFQSVAVYNVGYGIFKASSIAFSFIFVGGYTRISFLRNRIIGIKLYIKKYLTLILIISLIICLFVWLFSGNIISLFYPREYSSSTSILNILAFAIPGLALNNLTGTVLRGLGLFKYNMLMTFLALVLNITLNILFIASYGIMSAAIISLFTEYFIFTGDFILIKKYLKIKTNNQI